MHQTLSRYVTQSAAKTLSDLYTKISQAYARRPGDENLQNHLDGVKRTLALRAARRGSSFLCFRQTKERSSASGKGAGRRDEEGQGQIAARGQGWRERREGLRILGS